MRTSAPLTRSQYGIYAECMAHQGEVWYNIDVIYDFDGSLDEQRLKSALEATVANHPTLFTRIGLDEQGEPIQTIDDSETFSVEVEHVADIEAEKPKMVFPYQLLGDRLFRFRLLRDASRFYLLFSIHHIIGDGSSILVLLADLAAAYEGKALEPEKMSQADVAREETALRQTARFGEDKQWYAEHFDCGDCYSPVLPDQEGAGCEERGDGVLRRRLEVDAGRLDTFLKEHGIFKSTFFTAAYSFLLAKYNNEHESLFSTVYSGRADKRTERSVGMMVRTVPVYARFDDDTTVADYLKAGQEQMTGCRQHECYAFTDVMSDLKPQLATYYAWHGRVLDDVLIGGKPARGRQLGKNTLGVAFYFKALIQGGHYYAEAEYDADSYSPRLVGQFLESYQAVVNGFLTAERLFDIDIATSEQVALLDTFNQTEVPYDASQTVVSLFRRQAGLTPDNMAVVFGDKRYTYREVDDMSERIAAYIAPLVSPQGEGREGAPGVVSVLIPRCEWMAIASLGVLKAGCAYQPLDPSYPKERLNFMMKDAGTRLLIADETLRELVDEYDGEVLLTKDIKQLPIATHLSPQGGGREGASPRPEDVFILLYTSGTTGQPKGCQLTHGNLVAFCHWHQRRFNLAADCRVTAYASYGFDANMMDMYPALTCGAAVYIIPEELRLDLLALNEYMESEHITHAFMTTQVAYQFATSIENHSLRYLLTGGEKLAPITPPAGLTLVNLYGPTECTVCVTAFDVKQTLKDIPIGKALDNVRLYVVDKAGHRLPVGAAGELWASGPQVSKGYLNRPEKTAEVFADNPFADGRIYRTGDIVRYLPDGNIQFVGRRDGQVKIRGFRIELKEVESIIRQFPGIKDTTVQAFDEPGGGKFIAAYIVSDEKVDIEALNRFILDEKPPYMVPAVTMQIERIPLNQNQKVNKRALPEPKKRGGGQKTDSGEAAAPPLNVLEQELHDLIAKIINTDDFGLTTVLGYAGLTSIMAIKLAILVNKRFGVTLDSKTLAKTGTLQSIENEIVAPLLSPQGGKAVDAGAVHLPQEGSREGSFPLSYAQTGVYVDCMKNPSSTIYNIPTVIRLPKDTDVALLGKSLETVVRSHPQLFVRFGSEGSDIVQTVDYGIPVDIRQSTMDEAALEKYKKEFVKPFNLRQGPLFRMEIVSTESAVFLLADVHHLVFDGGSLDLLLTQLCDLLNGGEIEPEAISYADFVAEEKAAEDSRSFAEARSFFKERLGNVEGMTEVRSDLTNPVDHGTASETFFPMDFAAIEAFCRRHNLTPAHVTLAAVFYTLARFTNDEQLCITTISSGRSDLRIRNTVGMFVNTLALSALVGEQTVMEFLQETSRNFDDTLAHEKYPFAQIAADYDLKPDIMFAYQIGVIDQYSVHGQPLQVGTLELDAAKFRIAFFIQENADGEPGVLIEYDNGRYSPELMQSLARSVSNAASAFVRQPEAMLTTVSLLDEHQTALLDSFNQTEVPYDASQTVVSLFRRQAGLTPDNMAVVFGDKRYTYREVDDMSERIAAYIAPLVSSPGGKAGDADSRHLPQGEGREGIPPVVSILIPRCEWMAIASLGVLKAGCAYQPLDPSYPKERLNFMMKDAGTRLLIADETLRELVDEYDGEVLLTKDIKQLPIATLLSPQGGGREGASPRPDEVFILLYTSGSTGVPKGCQLEHRNLVAFCHWYQRRFGLKPEHHVACYASYGFDANMMDMYPALTCGACIYIIGDDIRLTLPEVNAYFERNHITHSFMTTQVAYQFATNYDNHSLRYLIAGGEKLASLTPPAGYTLVNIYGPTECTVCVTAFGVTQTMKDIPVGKALDNVRLYVVDKAGNRLPVGAAGELWVSGPQVSKGYLNRPEKTAEVYIDNPFADGRIYRTGDIVRYLPDGTVQFVGRRDGQVKIRGFRIELKEIETVIRQFPGIKDATVQAFDHSNGGKFVAAYIVSDEKVDIKALNAFIGRQKPSYMIPAVTMQIERILLNQNQKVNRKALPVPVIQTADHEYVEPANNEERLFCDIFAEILSAERIGATDNFFELGGTSLMVTRVIIEADKQGHHIAYGDVFANPTPRLLAGFVTGGNVEDDEVVRNYNYGAVDTLLKGNTLDAFLKGERQPIGHVLLTGATGFLGIHVLWELIERDDVPVIWCLVRADNEERAKKRLKGLMFYYFNKNYSTLFGDRIRIVNGDVTKDFSNLIPAHIDTVFNCAAVVKHFSKGTEIEDVNVGGALNCVSFCLRNHARLIHVSTYSTAGMSVNGIPAADTVFTEQLLYFGQNLSNQYVHSKFMSERIVLDAVALHGLNAKVMRVGNLAPRSTDGEFQINFQTNSAMGRIRVYQMLGCYPYSLNDAPMEFTPINEVARAIVMLSETPKACCLFHPFNNHTVHFGDVLQELAKVTRGPRQVEDDEFAEQLEAAKQDPEKAKRLSSLLAYQDMAHGQKVVVIPTRNEYTSQVLYRLGFRWSTTSWDYVDQMLAAIAGFGYFE